LEEFGRRTEQSPRDLNLELTSFDFSLVVVFSVSTTVDIEYGLKRLVDVELAVAAVVFGLIATLFGLFNCVVSLRLDTDQVSLPILLGIISLKAMLSETTICSGQSLLMQVYVLCCVCPRDCEEKSVSTCGYCVATPEEGNHSKGP
jgi:hypothetical protein